tara:strand:- start:126 stop:1136 length:1011 start_codon:yes stop_codon:yes gene_type:complete
MLNFKIGKKLIGGKRVFIIAEIGVNHNGNLSNCKNLVKRAKSSGADAVKLQIINPEESYSKSTKSYRTFKKNYLNYEEIKKIKSYAKKLSIILFATPGDFSSLSIIKKLNFPAIKISSGLLTNIPLIIEASKLKIPMIVSTGFANMNEIKEAVNKIKKIHNKIAILRCTSIYPVSHENLNLLSILNLKKNFNNIVGYSDHSLGDLACLTAVSLGSKIIEKHFTLDKKQPGADHKLSSTPEEFKLMVEKIRIIEKSLGDNNIFPTKIETKLKKFYHRTIIASCTIFKNQKLSRDNIALKRTNKIGTRIHPREFFNIIGKTSKKKITKDEIINYRMLK